MHVPIIDKLETANNQEKPRKNKPRTLQLHAAF